MTKRGQVVFHPCGDLGIDLTMNEPPKHQIVQTPTQCRCCNVQCTLEFIETNSFCLVQEVIQDVKHVRLAEEINESSSFGLKTHGCFLWLHKATKLVLYIKGIVSLRIPRFPQRNFRDLIGAIDGLDKEE